ncbi:MAG TPA: hypothetical protein DCX06_05900 [Opitutae bacterium]|nr:hypothetical protein [Opitutae bacterium]
MPLCYRRLLIFLATGLITHASDSVEILSWEATAQSLDKYCSECHSDDHPDADLDITSIDQESDLAANPEKWTQVLQALRTHYMPHPDGRNLPPLRRKELVTKVGHELIQQAADYDSQSAALRRLNRVEFSNTINDLLFLDGDWSESLPADDAGYGFDNIASALSISPLLIERYFDASARAAQIAVPQMLAFDEWALSVKEFTGGHDYELGRTIYADGEKYAIWQMVFFPGNGSYELQLTFSAQQAGPENAVAEIRLNGKKLGHYEITASQDDTPNRITATVQVDQAGEYKLEIRLVEDFYKKTKTEQQDRNLNVHDVHIKGPTQSKEDISSPFLDRHFGSIPEQLSTKELRDGIHRFASRAYRRPALSEEADDLWSVFLKNSNYLNDDRKVRNGIYAVIDAVLTSPSFLFRLEDPEQHGEFALASWLSYFLWSSMPDDRLFQLAGRNELNSQLDAELGRMLQSPKADALADNFAGQWWRLRDLDIHKPDRRVYDVQSRKLLWSMKQETKRFFLHVLKQDRPLLDFLNADYTFLNERLAQHYGIEGVHGNSFRQVSIKETPRRGVWSQGGILTITSYPNHTSPVLRGQWILENILGLSPPPPPDNIPSLPRTSGKPDPSDLRASLALHRDNPDCASCHNIMDPFGLALEHYDGVGGLRSLEERKQLTSEELFDGTEIANPAQLATYFETQRSNDFILNMARKLSIYAAGRGLDWRDEAALQRIADTTRRQDYRFPAMIRALTNEFAPTAKPASIGLIK